jgi:hypothetical protein
VVSKLTCSSGQAISSKIRAASADARADDAVDDIVLRAEAPARGEAIRS